MNYKKKYKQDVLNELQFDDKYNEIASKLNFKNVSSKKVMKKSVIFAACGLSLVLVVGVAGAIILSEKDVESYSSIVTMNLNPSVRFVLDKDNKVVSVSGENNEGKMIVAGEEENIVGKDINDAIELVLKVEKETGYLVSGSASIGENELSFSVAISEENVNKAKEIQESIKNEITSTVSKVCDELNINETISEIKAVERENLEKLALKYDSTLTEERVKEMSNEQLIDVVKLYSLETAHLYSVELEELYSQVKEYDLKFAESEFTKDAISSMGSIYELALKGYDLILDGLKTSITALNDLRYDCFVSEESLYQKSYTSLLEKKEEVILYKNQLASMEGEDNETKQKVQEALEKQIKVLETAEKVLVDAKDASLALIDNSTQLINKIIVELEEYKSNLPGRDEVEETLANKSNELQDTLNAKKDQIFADFENKYSDDIEKAKQKVLAYKESLKQSISQ